MKDRIQKLKSLLNVDVALVQGPMGGVSGPNLVAAVSNAGALGVLPVWADALDSARELIQATQKMTNKYFAINLRADLNQFEHIEMATEEGVRLFHLFWGDPSHSAKKLHGLGGHFIATVGDKDSAKRALDAGAVALVAQSVEAGGHVLGDVQMENLLIQMLAISGNVPVIAAGGIGTPTDAASLINKGASGVLCGSRFVASVESKAHALYKNAIIEAGANATVRSLCFDLGWSDAPHRTIVNATYRSWENAGFPSMGQRPNEADHVLVTRSGRKLKRYFVSPPSDEMSGDITEAAMYAGTGIQNISSIKSANEIINDFRGFLS